MPEKKVFKICLVIVLSIIISSLTVGYIGLKAGKILEINNRMGFAARCIFPDGIDFWRMSRTERILWSLKEIVGLEKFYSDYGQDKWIARFVFPDCKDGYFVDVGAGDGIISSNTKALEDRGWKGICIDPFPTNMETRTCTLFKEVVSGSSGQTISFSGHGFQGRMGSSSEKSEHGNTDSSAVFSTVTLDEILKRANAPDYINYISLDIEGAELEALKGFSFSKYKVGAFTIEHNHEEPKRTQIRMLLESKGYRFVLTLYRDDCYLSEDLLRKKYKSN